MAKYKIYFTEYVCHEFDYEAESEEEAYTKWIDDWGGNGCVDFSYGEVYDSTYKICKIGD